MDRFECGHCGKKEVPLWEGFDRYSGSEAAPQHDSGVFCRVCVNTTRKDAGSAQRFVPALAAMDVKIAKQQDALKFVVLKKPFNAPPLAQRTSAASVEEASHKDDEYGWRLSLEERRQTRHGVAPAFEVAGVHNYVAGSEDTRSLLSLFFAAKAQQTSEATIQEVTAAVAEAVKDGLQVMQGGTVAEAWTLVCALKAVLYSTLSPADDAAATERLQHGGEVGASADDPIRAAPILLTITAQENALFWGVVLHFFCHRHWVVVQRLLGAADGPQQPGGPSREATVEALSGLLVSGAHAMIIAAHRQRNRHIVHQQEFWDAFALDGAVKAKYAALNELRASWTATPTSRRAQSLSAYVDGLKECLCVYLASIRKNEGAFNRSFDQEGQGRAIEAARPEAAPAVTSAGKEDPMGDYMEGLRIAKSFILYQPFFFQGVKGEPYSQTDTFVRGDLWARMGCLQLLDTINRFLFRSAPTADGGGDKGITSAAAWQLMATVVKQFCLSTPPYQAGKVRIGTVLATVLRLTREEEERALDPHLNFDFGRNRDKDVTVSRQLLELLKKRGEAFLQSGLYDAAAAVKDFPFQLTKFLCGKMTAGHTGEEEVMRPCCDAHQRQRGASVSADFMSCSRCLLKVFFPGVTAPELNELGKLDYHLLDLKLKPVLSLAVNYFTDKVLAVEEHIQHVTELAFAATTAEDYKRRAESYLQGCNLLRQSLAVVEPYVKKMYDKLSNAKAVKKLVAVGDGSFACIWKDTHVKLSQVMAVVRGRQEKVRYIQVYADFTLDIDCDVRLPGVSLLLDSFQMRLNGSHTFDMSGADATTRGKNGAKGRDGNRVSRDGEDGEMGHSGLPGCDGGNICVRHETPLKAVGTGTEACVLTLRSKGGVGGAGGNGGAGGDGYTAANLPDATLEMFIGATNCGGHHCQYSMEPLRNDELPGRAGQGGGLGSGGIGGRRGEISAAPTNVDPGVAIVVAGDSVNGSSGPAGKPGRPGVRGGGGRDGQALDLTYAFHYLHKDELIECESYYALADKKEYYDGFYSVRGREQGSTGSTKRTLSGGRAMYCNYTWGRFVCLRKAYITQAELGAREFVSGGVVRSFDDFDNTSSTAVSNPVEQAEQRLSFEEVQEKLGGALEGLAVTHGADRRECDLNAGALLANVLAAEAHGEAVVLDNLFSMTLGEAIVAMERSSSFEESLKQTEYERVQAKAQVMMRFRAASGASDGVEGYFGDGYPIRAPRSTQGGVTVPELDAIGPLYELAGVIDELNAAVVHTQRSEKHFSLYLRLLMNVVGVIENKFAENAFVLTYVDIFYSKSLFQIETELFRVGEPCLLSLVQPSPDKLPQLPAELERSVYRAMTYRYMVTMAGQLASTVSERPSLAAPSAASAPHSPPAKAPTARGPPSSGGPARAPRVPQAPRLNVPPPIPADHGSQLARVRVCAERLRYCAAAQVRPALREAKVAMAVCPLFTLSALPDFAVKWPRTLRLAEMLFRTPIDGARSLLPMYADDAVEEFRRWVAQLPSDPKGVDSLAHPLARRTLDWLRLSPTRLPNLLSRSFIEAHIRIVLDAPGRCPGLSALRILSNWKEVIEDGEFLPLFCRAASHRELDEWDPHNLPDDVREVFSVLLAYTHERRLFDRECQRDSSVVWRYDTPSANFLVKTIILLLKLHVVQRGMEARFNLFASEAPTGECFCTTAKREHWTITDALESVEQIGDLENCAFSWRVPCWECLPFAEQLRDAGPEEHLISMPKYRRLTSCIKQGNSVSLESLLQTRTPHVVSAVLHGWAQLDPSSEAGAIAAWMASLHCCVAEAGAAAVDGARLPDTIWTELQYAPPSMQVLVGVLDATRWNHAPFRFDLSVLAECSCFPIRKHAAHRLTEVATGPYATRLRTMLDKVYDIVGDAKLDALLHPLLDSPDLEHILRVLCQHYLEHWAKKIFGAGDYTSLLKQPILSLTRYACVEAVLVVVDAFAKQFSDPRNTARVYPEYLNGALQALEGLHMTDEVATALTGLEVSGWMTALQRRRFYQCIHLWWLSRNVKFPSHEMYHWMLHVGENNFQRFMHATRSLSNNAVNSVLRDFLAVPSPQRGALGKLRDALSGSGITTARVREYKRAWDDKRRQVVDALRYSDTARVEAHARTWERSWEDILTFVKEEGVAISAELLNFCRDVHEELQRVVAKPASARRDLIELFTVGFKANQQGAASNGGAEKVFAMEKAVLHDMGRQRCIVIAIFLGFYETRKLLPRRVQVLAVVALLQGSVLANINTSEGKTYITGCVLAFKLYCGYRVAFATSGFDLASRAMDFNNGAFHLLFGGDVRAAVEDADTVRPNDNVYRAHMVYTTEGNVSSRILRTLLDPTDERAFREWRGFAHWLVQDEADVPMVQSLTEAMYVGGPSLNARRDVLTFPALMACGANRDSTEAALHTWQQRLRPLCTSESDPILAENRFRSLWESARSVWRVANNREYVVVNDRSVPYNTETGETLYTSSWKEGLSTMVCIKERQRWEWEAESSLTVDPLSVFSVFFKNRLTAVTGTAGGYATQAIYQRVYGLKPVSIPPAFFSLFDEQPPELYTTEESYYKGVESSVYRAIQNGQDVLVAVDTVAEADRMLQHVQRELTSRAAATRNIVFQRYAREKMDEVPCLTSGRRHVFFMTFLGGRGLDVMPQRNQLNGIHVILCSAQHERATHQVLRRAARQYHPGSGQIICFQNSPQSSDDYLKYAVDKREEFYKHQNKVMERERRRLQVLAAKEIPQALLRQELQQIVQDCVAELRVKGDQYLFVSYVVQHSFAAWLEKHEAVISTRGEEVGCREQLLKSLRRDVTDRFARTSLPDIAALARFARTTDERVILANLLRSTVVDLPWCSDGAFALFAAVKDGTCPYGIPEIVHALAAAQAADVPRVRQHVRSFLDVLGQWVASLEQFTADLQDLHTEVGGSAGNGGEAGGDVLYINASVSYLGRLREHYQTLVGTDGALVLAMFQQNGLSFAETVTTIEALVRNGFVDDAQASTTPATWMAGLKSHKGELPSLTEKKMPPPSSSLAALQYCCQEGVDMREADLLFAGKVPLLAPLRLSPALFDDHARTYMEKLKATSIPHAELTCGILLSCAGLLRKGQVHRLLIVSAYAKFKDVADTEIIYDWTSLGYQHVVDVEQRTSTATNESARDEENWRRAAANAFWGLVEMGRTFGSAAVTAVSVSCLVNRLFPRTRALFTSSVVPFIKKGVVAAERWVGGDRLHEAGMLTQCIEGMANVFAASSINKVAAYLKETFGSSSVLQRVGALCSSAKDTVQRSLQQAKGIFSVNVYFALHPADFFRQVLRRSKLFFLRLVMKLAIPEVRRVSTTDFDNNIDATIRKRLRTPLLEIVATVRRQKPAHVTRFLNGALPHLQRATGQEDLSEYLLGVNSAVETFDKALRATGTDSVKETAALMLRLWDSTAFVHAARTEPQQIVEETCDAYVARCWSFAEEAHGLHRSCAESSDAADVDAVESMFVSHCEQLLRKRVVTPLRSALQRITNAFARSIHAAVDRVEAGATTRSVQTPQGDFENEEDPSAVAPANDAVRFTLRNSLLHDGPSNGVTLSYYMRSDFGTKVSSAIGSAHAQTSSEVARRGGGTGTAVGFLNNALGRRIFGAGLGLVVSDKALVGQLMRLASGNTFIPAVRLTTNPTTAETVLMIVLVLYDRINVRRRLQSTTFVDGVFEIAIAVVSEIKAAERRFQREKGRLALAFGPFSHLRPLFQKAVAYASLAYEKERWSAAVMYVEGTAQSFPTYQIYLDAPSELVVVAFRGSTTWRDFVSDALCLPVQFCGVDAHRGFAMMTNSFFNNAVAMGVLQRLVTDNPTYRVLLTGHSLGGSLAVLSGVRLLHEKRLGENLQARLFVVAVAGAPATTHQFAQTDNFFNVVNQMDVVPRVQLNSIDRLLHVLFASFAPLITVMAEFRHPTNTFLFSADDEIKLVSGEIASNIYCSYRMLGDHSCAKYVAALSAQKTED